MAGKALLWLVLGKCWYCLAFVLDGVCFAFAYTHNTQDDTRCIATAPSLSHNVRCGKYVTVLQQSHSHTRNAKQMHAPAQRTGGAVSAPTTPERARPALYMLNTTIQHTA